MTTIRKTINDTYEPTANLPELLYDNYAPGLLSLCLRYCGNIEDAEDVLHDGFIKIIRNVNKFRKQEKGTFEGWMKRIMVNTALNFLRDSARERHFLDFDPFNEIIPAPENEESFMDILEEKIEMKILMDMICELPSGYRTVFNLYVFESYSHRAIAAELHCTENTSKSQLSKARAMLRKRLNDLMVNQNENK